DGGLQIASTTPSLFATIVVLGHWRGGPVSRGHPHERPVQFRLFDPDHRGDDGKRVACLFDQGERRNVVCQVVDESTGAEAPQSLPQCFQFFLMLGRSSGDDAIGIVYEARVDEPFLEREMDAQLAYPGRQLEPYPGPVPVPPVTFEKPR